MRRLALLIALCGASLASAAELTGRELALVRIIMRLDMQADLAAAAVAPNDIDANDVAPLETALTQCPAIDALNAIMTDESNSPSARFNAARALAYTGDRRCLDMLSDIVEGNLVLIGNPREKEKAALCLLYFEYPLAHQFLFTRLEDPLYPELNSLLEHPNHDPKPPEPLYSTRYDALDTVGPRDRIVASVLDWLGPYIIEVRGPLSTLDVENREFQRDLEWSSQYGYELAPFSFPCWDEWQTFRAQMEEGDLIYYFITDEISWSLLGGREGYALIRGGQVVAVLITTLN